MKRDVLERIDAEVAEGRPWRAKEIVRGHIAATWPEPAVIERYGQLLADLGDRLEAGKFLFLSGARKPKYDGDIALFLGRHRRSGPGNLVAQFPKSFRRQQFGELPPQLQRELRALGVGESAFGERARSAVQPTYRLRDFLVLAFGLALLMCLFVGVAVGFRQIVLWISTLLR